MPTQSAAVSFFKRLAEPLLEKRCVSCAAPFTAQAKQSALCPPCAALLVRRSAGYCPRCGNILQSTHLAAAPCGNCLTTRRSWDGFFFHGEYQGLLRDLILRFKAGHELPLATVLGGFLAAHPDLCGPYDAILPLPLHPKRLRMRGFNQSAEIGAYLSRHLQAPLVCTILERVVDTRPQAELSLKERQTNVQGIFSVRRTVPGSRFLLVDDVATTCATLESAAAVLKKAGASIVDAAVIARTPQNGTT